MAPTDSSATREVGTTGTSVFLTPAMTLKIDSKRNAAIETSETLDSSGRLALVGIIRDTHRQEIITEH